MTTVTILETETTDAQPKGDQRSISAALTEGVVIADSKGRRLKLKRPTILQESRLVRALGEFAENPTYLNAYALPCAMVVEIDGEAIIFPTSQLTVDGAIQRVGREGMTAVIEYITSKPAERTEDTAALKL